jgi:hypothetical protein
VVTSYIGAGAARFFLSLNPELPDPAFAKIIVRTPDAEARAALSTKLAGWIAEGRYPEARVRIDRLLFGPAGALSCRVPGRRRRPRPDPTVAAQVRDAMEATSELRGVHLEWGERALVERLEFDQARLRLIGLTPQDAANQLQALLSGVTVTQMREDLRTGRRGRPRRRRRADRALAPRRPDADHQRRAERAADPGRPARSPRRRSPCSSAATASSTSPSAPTWRPGFSRRRDGGGAAAAGADQGGRAGGVRIDTGRLGGGERQGERGAGEHLPGDDHPDARGDHGPGAQLRSDVPRVLDRAARA